MEEGSVAWMGKPHSDISGSEINWFCLQALPSDQLGPSRTCCSPGRADRRAVPTPLNGSQVYKWPHILLQELKGEAGCCHVCLLFP